VMTYVGVCLLLQDLLQCVFITAGPITVLFVCLLLQDLLQSCSRGGEEESVCCFDFTFFSILKSQCRPTGRELVDVV
jgi:hypothetical protein